MTRAQRDARIIRCRVKYGWTYQRIADHFGLASRQRAWQIVTKAGTVAALPVCSICLRGREACEYCENASEQDWRAMCDCGLHDFGAHLTDCESQEKYRYVIARDYDSAVLPRQP